MSNIKNTLINFLSDDSARVAILKGEWGIGKTYFWNELLAKSASEVSCKSYAYISLFGVVSLDDIKTQIISCSRSFESIKEDYDPESSPTLKEAKGLEKHKKWLPVILETVEQKFLNTSNALNVIFDTGVVSNMLVCFDDIERIEEGFPMTAFLGLVTRLKVEKKCKVMMILNEGVNKDVLEKLERYRDKIVDIEIAYRPSIEENLKHIWKEQIPERVQDVFEKLNLNNIRIMSRVKAAQDYFENLLGNEYKLLREDIDSKAAILTSLFYGFSEDFNLEEVTAENQSLLRLFGWDDDKDELDEEGQRKYDILQSVGYFRTDSDPMVVDYLQNGYVDINNYKAKLLDNTECRRVEEIQKEFRGILKKYRYNFVTPQEEFITDITDFVKTNAADIGLNNLYYVTGLIKDIDPSVDLENLLKSSIKEVASKMTNFNRLDLEMHGFPKPLVDSLEANLPNDISKYTLSEIMESLGGSGNTIRHDEQYFEAISDEDLEKWIVTTSGIEVIPILAKCLKWHMRNESGNMKIVERIEKVLKVLKGGGSIDRVRIEREVEKWVSR